jgi:hypothetical protein
LQRCVTSDRQNGYQATHDGPVVRVLTNDETQFLADVTRLSGRQVDGGSITAQQAVQAVEQPLAIPYPAFISVWGQWQNDVLLADVVLYDVPGD